MRIHVLQHVPFEDAANIGVWARARDHEVTRTLLYAGESPPQADAFDWLVVMGGPMNADEEARYPWLAAEKRRIAEAVEAGRTVLGVCLGAQLLASVLGGRVYRAARREIGWFPVRLTGEGRRDPFLEAFPSEFLAFHWHGDTFDLPPGALRVAETDACPNQAFVVGRRLVGLQFHLDYSEASIRKMIAHCAGELTGGPFVQPAEAMLPAPARIEATQALLETLLDRLAGEE